MSTPGYNFIVLDLTNGEIEDSYTSRAAADKGAANWAETQYDYDQDAEIVVVEVVGRVSRTVSYCVESV